jgi:AraC-like DNA-binding protein
MPVVLDTAAIAPADRAEAVRQAMAVSCGTVTVGLDGPPERVRARFELFALTAGSHIFTHHGTGFRMSPRIRPGDLPADRLSLGIQRRARSVHRQHGVQRLPGSDGLMSVDLTAGYDFRAFGEGVSQSLNLDLGELGVGVDDARRAVREMAANPLAPLLRRHLVGVFDAVEVLTATPAGPPLLAATLELARAFVLAAGGAAGRREALGETLLARITDYLRAHLGEPDLGPARVAAAHHISVRHLHALWSTTGTTLRQWIVAERLAAARAELTDPAARSRTIAAIAHTWGFTDAAHFSRRYREAFGVSPREQRATAAATWPST